MAWFLPHPNAANWHRTPVSVSFDCHDPSGIQSCPAPIIFTTEGVNQTSVVHAIDSANNQTTLAVTANVDLTPPTVAFTSPPPAFTSNPSIDIEALVSDGLSGVANASCDTSSSVFAGGVLTCTLTIKPGRNLVRVYAVDLAGNTRTAVGEVVRACPTSAFEVSPQQLVLLVGDERPIAVTDCLGQTIPGNVSWTSSNDAVAHTDSAGTAVVALAPGQVTLTASNGETAREIDVSVLPGTVVDLGTTVWRVHARPGMATQAVIPGEPDASGPTVLTAEWANGGDGVIRAIGGDGAEKWSITTPGNYVWPLSGKGGGALFSNLWVIVLCRYPWFRHCLEPPDRG